MPNLVVTTRKGEERTIDATTGISVMEAIRNSDIPDIQAICGGSCSCATCHVHIDADWLAKLPGLSDDERDLLDNSAYRKFNSRLSCQIPVIASLDGLRLTIAQED